MHFFLEKIVFFCVSCLEGGEASAKHRAEGEPGRERPRRGNAQILDNEVHLFYKNIVSIPNNHDNNND